MGYEFMEELREKLYKRILEHGTKDKEALELSQLLDLYIVKEQQRMGTISDIVEKVVPKAQQLIAKDGLGIKQALSKAFYDMGYIKGEVINENVNENKNR